MYRRWICCICAVVLYPVATLAADNNAITVRLLAPNPEVCLGQKLGLEAVLTNSGKSAIQVSTIGVRGGISLSRYKEDTPEFVANYLAELIPDAIKNGPWVWIPAHQSVSVPFTEPMDQSDPVMEHAYDSPGFFSMQIEFAVFTRPRPNLSNFGEMSPPISSCFTSSIAAKERQTRRELNGQTGAIL
jgi:hypothetical protein